MDYYGLEVSRNARIRDIEMRERRTSLDRLLRTLPSGIALEALTLLEKILQKIIDQPGDDKWRQLSKSNAKLLPILGNRAGLNILRQIGWEVDEDLVVLPLTVTIEYRKHLAKVIAAKDHVLGKKALEDASKSLLRSRNSAGKLDSDGIGSLASTAAPGTDASSSVLSQSASSPTDSQVEGAFSEVSQLGGQQRVVSEDMHVHSELGMCCDLGHPLSWAQLNFHEGWLFARECNLCGADIPREAIRLRCEECRFMLCTVGRNRDAFCVCSACAERASDHSAAIDNEGEQILQDLYMDSKEGEQSSTLSPPGAAAVPIERNNTEQIEDTEARAKETCSEEHVSPI